MNEPTKKVVLPAYLSRRLEAFRIVRGDESSYLLRDKVLGKTFDLDAWQFFILEMLPGCEQLDKLQTAFQDRFDRQLTKRDVDEFFATLADQSLLDERASQHPLLAPFTQRTYDVQDGKAVPKPVAAGVPAPGVAAVPAPAAQPAEDAELPAGVQDALGLDWRSAKSFWGLFDPRALLDLLLPLARPLRHVIYALPILLLAAILLLFKYFDLFSGDLAALNADITLAEHLIFLFLTVHVASNLVVALTAHHFKVSVDQVGFTLAFGFMPRWVLKMTGAERMTRKQVLWLHAGPLLVRMLFFSLGVLVWFNFRDAGATMAQLGLLMSFVCAAGLLLETGNPLVKANGYYLLAAYLNEPHLRGKAFAALWSRIKGGVYRASDSRLLALYALLSATYMTLIVLVIGAMLANYVFGDLALGGSGIIIVAAFVGFMLWRNYTGLKRFGQTYEKQAQFDRWRTRTVGEAADAELERSKTSYWKVALLVGFVVALFLPYPYEPGGAFQIFPARKQVLATDEPGLVAEVYFDGGEAVKAGTVIARLNNQDSLAQIGVLAAQIDEQQAVLENLRTLPRPQEVALAQQQLDLARTREKFSGEKAPRLEKLHKVGAVSLEEYQATVKEHQSDLQQVAEKEAALALVKAPVTASEIAAAEAKLQGLIGERAAIEGRIGRTTLTMPFDGNILTLHLKDRVNTYLEKGVIFATVEDTSTVTAAIEVPESEIQFVDVGATVRLRATSYASDREFEGTVSAIDRNVTIKPTGNVVQVIATIDNRDGLLRTGMSGQAKIEGKTMPVWKAFTLSIMRFIQVQVWSWLP